jgi:hypothetical protein
MRRPRRRHVHGDADGQPLEGVVEIGGGRRAVDVDLAQASVLIVEIGIGGARARVGDDVAGRVGGEASEERSVAVDMVETIAAGDIGISVVLGRAAGNEALRGAIAARVVAVVQRSPRSNGRLQTIGIGALLEPVTPQLTREFFPQ